MHTPGQLLQGFLRGVSPRPIEGTIKAQPFTPGQQDGVPYLRPIYNNGLNGSDPATPGRSLRNPGDTFLDEYSLVRQHNPAELPGNIGLYEAFKSYLYGANLPRHELESLMHFDYNDNSGKLRQMRQLGAQRGVNDLRLTWESNTVGDGRSNQYYHFQYRNDAYSPYYRNYQPEFLVWRNLSGVAMTPLPLLNQLRTGLTVLAMPVEEWAKATSGAPDPREIAKAMYWNHTGAVDRSVEVTDNSDGSISVRSPYNPVAGSVDAALFDTSPYGQAHDMLVVAMNYVQPSGTDYANPGPLVREHPNLWPLIKRLRNGTSAKEPDIRDWLDGTNVHAFYLSVSDFIARRIGAGQAKY